MNMHHTHIQVKHDYAGVDIHRIRSLAHNNGMKKSARQHHYLRQWRKLKPGRTLEIVAAELHMSQPQLGRIERGDQPYNQDLLESLAVLYGCTVADLLMRDPTKPDNIWSIWDRALPGQKDQIVAVAAALVDQERKAG